MQMNKSLLSVGLLLSGVALSAQNEKDLILFMSLLIN